MACADEGDPHHRSSLKARVEALEAGSLLLTTDYVIDETLTLLRVRLSLAVAKIWWSQIDGSPRLRVEQISPSRAEKARALFFRYTDKNFSFTDCTSFVVMQELRLDAALSTDQHFKQMGFLVRP